MSLLQWSGLCLWSDSKSIEILNLYGAKEAEQLLAFYGKLVLTRAKVRTAGCALRKSQSAIRRQNKAARWKKAVMDGLRGAKEKAYVQKWKIHVAMWKSCLILWTENGTLCWSVPFLNENRFDIVNWSREWLIFPIWLWPMRWRHCSMHKSLIGALTTRCRPGGVLFDRKRRPAGANCEKRLPMVHPA